METKLKSQAINIDSIYPVGSIYITTVSTNPSNYFGGTWVAFGAGKTLVGLDSKDTDFDTSEETGGVKSVTLTAAQSGLPAHNHTIRTNDNSYAIGIGGGDSGTNGMKRNSTSDKIISVNNTAANASQAHTNLQPYIVTYMFKRTA